MSQIQLSCLNPSRWVHTRCVSFVLLLLVLAIVLQPAYAEKLQFDRDIRPILSDKCYACHGPDPAVRQANLRLDTKEGAFSAPSGYPIIVPGEPENSELVLRITHENIDQRMPPQISNRQPTQEQIDTLIQWIAEGAEWEEHWVYNLPKRVEPPTVGDTAWVRNPIDAFILGRLAAEGLTPSAEADKRTLIRRLSFDLTGLLPTPTEVEHFLRDETPDAYESLVNTFLSEPQYGERMAMYWLDLVRYADTSGYHSDENVSVWPYRDYVIQAFNDNMPFDQFTVENLAGDLLPNPTPVQKVAAGYNRLNQTTAEGGAQAKEYLSIYAADRVRTTASVWLGATLGCAQCHDHKFDPYTAKDFYSFAAFFADVKGPGVYGGNSKWEPVVMLPTPMQESALRDIDDELTKLQKVFKASSPGLEAKQAEWENEIRSLLASMEPTDFAWVDDAQANGGSTEGTWEFVGKMKHLFSVNFYHVAKQRQLNKQSSTLSEVPIESLLWLRTIGCLHISGLTPNHLQRRLCSNGTTEIGIIAHFGVRTRLTSVGLETTHLLTNRWDFCQQSANGFVLRWIQRMLVWNREVS